MGNRRSDNPMSSSYAPWIDSNKEALIRQMERHTHESASCLFLYNPMRLYALHKAVAFVPCVTEISCLPSPE